MNELTKHKRILTVLNVVVVTGLIVLQHIGFFDSGEWFGFVLFCAGLFVLALYQPWVVFVLLVGVVPIEIINIAPDILPIDLRPYQLLTTLLVLAVIVRRIFGGEKFIFKAGIFDILVSVLIVLGFVSAFLSPFDNSAIKQALVVFSFGLLYFVVRFFVRKKDDVLALFPIMVSSGVVIGIYAIVQNILFTSGGVHAEVMPGRPNATFAEPDWLGIYLVFVCAVILAYLYYSVRHKHLWKFFDIALFGSATVVVTALIITVARSAWVGFVAVAFAYLLSVFLQKKYKLFGMHSFWIVSVGVFSLIIVSVFSLTNFELLHRASSTSSGLQEITIACDCSGQTCLSTTTVIENVEELTQYNCKHINLEDVESEKTKGLSVLKIYRKDPNVVVRTDVYNKTITLIKQSPVLGYGWGSSGQMLGNDENGTPLNASNIFLETALSVGLLGVGVLIAIFILGGFYAVRSIQKLKNTKQKSVAIFVLVGLVAIIVPNLFNAGLFLGLVWLFMGMLDGLRKV